MERRARRDGPTGTPSRQPLFLLLLGLLVGGCLDEPQIEDRWTRVRVETGISPFLEKGKVLDLPVAHKEGRFVVRDPAMLALLERNGQVALRYLEAERDEPARGYPANPSGSSAAIAGIVNASGNVLGLMPHPERHLRALNHPSWTRKAAVGGLPADEERAGDGYPLFARAVAHV